jgi:hypothetical protein
MMKSYLKRQPNESILDYKFRICDKRDEYGLTWADVRAILNDECGENFSAETYRKQYEQWKVWDEHVKGKLVTDEEILAEIKKERMELFKERVRLQDQRRELNKVIRNTARLEFIMEELRKSIVSVEPPKFEIKKLEERNKILVAGFADVHYGKRFKSVNNEYNEEIARLRMNKLLNEIIEICLKEKITKVHVVNAADSVEGMSLRASQLVALEIGFIDMIIRFSRMMAEWLNNLSKYVNVIYHHVPSANHTELRPLGTKAGQFPMEDMERIIAFYVHDILANNERIHVPEYDRDFARFKVFDYLIYAKHGHQISNLKTYIKDLATLHREFIDYLIVGHLHHSEETAIAEGRTNNCELLMLPSIMGSDEFSDKLMTGAKAGAKAYVFEEGKGKSITYDIILN